jgi:hypothetical protein
MEGKLAQVYRDFTPGGVLNSPWDTDMYRFHIYSANLEGRRHHHELAVLKAFILGLSLYECTFSYTNINYIVHYTRYDVFVFCAIRAGGRV